MDLFSKENVENLLKSQSALPQKKLGQNFLTDKAAMGRILEAAGIQPGETVLEIGAGIGNLTLDLAKRAKKVIAVEKDQKMIEILKINLGGLKNVQIVEGDIRNLNPETLAPYRTDCSGSGINLKSGGYKVVANIPYYLTAFLIRNLLENKNPPKDMTLVVQKEVAQRICPRSPKPEERRRGKTTRLNLLAVAVQFYAKPKIMGYIKKSSFWPVPKVDSAILKITPHKAAAPHQCLRHDAGLREQFFKIVRSGFSQPRKQLLNNLANGLKMDREEVKSWLQKNNIQPTQRAETLSLEDWINLAAGKR